jgi:hypothetical protein
MSKRNRKKGPSASARILLACVFAFGQTAWAGQNQNAKAYPTAGSQTSTPPAAKAAPQPAADREEATGEQSAAAQEKASQGGRHEGIHVHGHWTIEVRNPDGTVVTHREFENSLVTTAYSGALLLPSLLARNGTVGWWEVVLAGGGLASDPCFTGAVGAPCHIIETPLSGVLSPDPLYSFTLNVTGPNPFTTGAGGGGGTGGSNPPPAVTLTGTVVAQENGGVGGVSTNLVACPSTFTPAMSCIDSLKAGSGETTFSFTSASITLVPVAAGQTIAVTVQISFS